ncbi:MAG: hypothetical protein IT427_00805 [Pirellulales bacterium]|nr:hypothetical protein [Pirellulales bacterium]
MIVRPLSALVWSLLIVLASSATSIASPPASDTLLPATTKGYIAVPDMARLLAYFNKSQFGQLFNDPAMQPFVDDFRHQLQQKGLKQLDQLGLSWEELESIPGGETALAVIQPNPDSAALALIVDVTGRQQMAEALLEKVAARMARNGAKQFRRQAGDPIVAYQLAVEPDRKVAPTAAYYLRNNLLVASDSIPVMESIVAATTSSRQDSLANVPAYREIMARCRASAGVGEVIPDFRWFIEPFGYVEALRSELPPRERRKGPDLLKVFKNQGFTAIQGVGGFVNFSAGKYELVHRTAIYAPPLPGRETYSKDKYNLAARMLCFPPGGELQPQSWVPSDIATYTTFNWDMKTAFINAETLVDEMVGEKGVFRDVLESLRDDSDGPMVDIEKNLVAHLGDRATVITDNEIPIGPRSERKVFAAELTNERVVAETIHKLMESDKDAHRREFEKFVIWEIVPAECEVPNLEIEGPGGKIQPVGHTHIKRNKEERLLSTSAICVAHGQLYCASHIEFLKKVLSHVNSPNHLSAAADFQLVSGHAATMGSNGSISFRTFSRMDEELRPTYELIRTGQMPRAETLLGQILNSVLGEGKEGVLRKQRIDGAALPEFDAVRKYLGPAGFIVSSLEDGWLCIGFALPRATAVETGVDMNARAELRTTTAESNSRKAEGDEIQAIR